MNRCRSYLSSMMSELFFSILSLHLIIQILVNIEDNIAGDLKKVVFEPMMVILRIDLWTFFTTLV